MVFVRKLPWISRKRSWNNPIFHSNHEIWAEEATVPFHPKRAPYRCDRLKIVSVSVSFWAVKIWTISGVTGGNIQYLYIYIWIRLLKEIDIICLDMYIQLPLGLQCFFLSITYRYTPETNITPENRPSQKETHLPTINFQALSEFQGVYVYSSICLRISHCELPNTKYRLHFVVPNFIFLTRKTHS